ncbi:hypothetical protein [Salmonirosea aquatica]|uniref:Uncharacterized protein n=1 Tax=Salmonirosea aquatica TaxID=2654236 RepID=A0A7C9F4X5_9BACT|nr:hypothetical protein [Cytophagaceae bacterium SJW1-29]
MEPITTTAMISAVVTYLAKKLKDNESVQDFFSDFTEATVNWIKPIFITEDKKPKEIIEDLKADPADELNTGAVENALAKALKRNPEAEADLKAMYDSLQAKASRGESIRIMHSKNVNTGNVNTGGGDFRQGDN